MEILTFGHSLLAKKTTHIELPLTEHTRCQIEKIVNLIAGHTWAGISAPQIDLGLCFFVFRADKERISLDEEPIPLTVAINPSLRPLSDKIELAWERCLSYSDFDGEVPRYDEIESEYCTLDGLHTKKVLKGFSARVFQHECDHLNGILFPQRMRASDRFRIHGTDKIASSSAVWADLESKNIRPCI